MVRRSGNAKHAINVKFALAISYIMLIAQSIEAEHAAVQADTQRLAGGTNGWFGKYWALAWIINLLLIVGLHAYLSHSRRSKDTSNSIIS